MVCLGHDLPDLVHDKPHEASAEGMIRNVWLFPTSTFIDYLLKGFVCRRNDVNCPFPTRYDGKQNIGIVPHRGIELPTPVIRFHHASRGRNG